MDPRQALQMLQQDARYRQNLGWGKPRSGHPEGSLENHIADLEANLQAILPHLVGNEEHRLRLLVHVHDICKPEARAGVLSDHPLSHSFLAQEYLRQFCPDPQLLAITRHHDDGYIFYCYFRIDPTLSEQLRAILEAVQDVELYLLFVLIDGCSPGKSTAPLDWLLSQVERLRPVPERIHAARRTLDPKKFMIS